MTPIYSTVTARFGDDFYSLAEDIQAKARTAVSLFEDAFNTMEIFMWFQDYHYTYTTCRGWWWWRQCTEHRVNNFNWNDGKTPEDVYTNLKLGRETLSGDADYDADVFLDVDLRWNNGNVIGYTYPNTQWQWIYRKIITNWDEADIASNIAHEWAHKMGYDHAYKWHETRQYTVPYAFGYKIGDIATRMARGEEFDMIMPRGETPPAEF